jgi:predicted SAM-dependent methyltransferase
MRIAMPDLASLVDRYRGDWADQAWLRTGDYQVTSGAQMLNLALREWGHRYVYDFEDLSTRLRSAGFTRLERVEWGKSSNPLLCGLETREDSMLVVEAAP